MLTDSHTHLYLDSFAGDRNEVVERALEKGITRMYLPNIDRGTVEPLLKLSQTFPSHCFPMLGLHPTSVKADYEKELEVIAGHMEQHRVAAIGEIGIDLYWDNTHQQEQEAAFQHQLEQAKEMNLPVVIHARDSFKEIFRVMDRVWDPSLKGIFHSFTGGKEELEKIRDYRFMVGINGIVTFKNSGLAEVAREIPPDKLLLETDAPFLAPVPFRGKRNESSYLIHVAGKLAEIHGMSLDELASVTTENALEIFTLH